MKKHILVVDDEALLAAGVLRALRAAGYAAETAGSVDEALSALRVQRADMIVLDIGMPGRSGLDLLTELRAQGQAVPVLLLSSFNEADDRVRGLETGADDYLGKPFALPELLARVRAILRRAQVAEEPETGMLEVGDLQLNLKTRDAHRGGVPLHLTAREFDMVACLAEQHGTVMTREMLARRVWGDVSRSTPIANVIDVQIGRLRKKLDDPFPTRLLHTVRGLGFILRQQEGGEA